MLSLQRRPLPDGKGLAYTNGKQLAFRACRAGEQVVPVMTTIGSSATPLWDAAVSVL